MKAAGADHALPGRMNSMGRFLQKLLQERPRRRRSPGIAGYLKKQGVGATDPEDPRYIVYAEEHFERAEHLLRAAGLPLVCPEPEKVTPSMRPASLNRSVQPAVDTSKSSDSEPVAVSGLNGAIDLPAGSMYLVMTAADAAAVPHDVVMYCQNLLSLTQLQQNKWVMEALRGRRVLALWRGGAGVPRFNVFASDRVIAESGAPVMALVDITVAGLSAAARLPRLERLCVPSWTHLERQLRAGSAEPVPSKYQVLDSATHPDIARAWKVLRWYPRGVATESLFDRRDSGPTGLANAG
ncbi:MAG: hypothetical protein K0Q43_97 [Ramlibacter sp.]|jgi:hypothetical protein|nr:hypothetical protein [Ramlibacter sp.]